MRCSLTGRGVPRDCANNETRSSSSCQPSSSSSSGDAGGHGPVQQALVVPLQPLHAAPSAPGRARRRRAGGPGAARRRAGSGRRRRSRPPARPGHEAGVDEPGDLRVHVGRRPVGAWARVSAASRVSTAATDARIDPDHPGDLHRDVGSPARTDRLALGERPGLPHRTAGLGQQVVDGGIEAVLDQLGHAPMGPLGEREAGPPCQLVLHRPGRGWRGEAQEPPGSRPVRRPRLVLVGQHPHGDRVALVDQRRIAAYGVAALAVLDDLGKRPERPAHQARLLRHR